MTEEPYWLDEAYRYPINLTDTGIISRNIYSAKILSPLIFFLFGKSASGLDYAGGYGIFTRLMRDLGFNFYWHDPLTENIFARGFEISDQSIDLVTTFDSFEHFINPLKEIEDILKISDNIFFSTVLLPEKIPEQDEWWYYGFEHGQHISFYNINTLKFIAKIFDMNLYSNGRWFHLLTKKKISNVIFNLLIAGSHLGLFTIVKTIMKSKIFDDMKYLVSEKI